LKNVLISGYYGSKNGGDEAMLAAILQTLRELDGEINFTVISLNTEYTKQRHNVEAVAWWNVFAIVKKILSFLQKLDDESLNKISEVAIISEDYIVAYTNTGEKSIQIRIGKLERLDDKARLTEDFLKDLATNPNPIEYIDFNYTAPFIKLAK